MRSRAIESGRTGSRQQTFGAAQKAHKGFAFSFLPFSLQQEVLRRLSIPTSEAPDCSMDNEQPMNSRRFKQYKELTLTGLPGHRRHQKAILREAKAICHRRTLSNEIVPGPYASLIWVRQSSRDRFRREQK
jgi:hypothetical protein